MAAAIRLGRARRMVCSRRLCLLPGIDAVPPLVVPRLAAHHLAAHLTRAIPLLNSNASRRALLMPLGIAAIVVLSATGARAAGGVAAAAAAVPGAVTEIMAAQRLP